MRAKKNQNLLIKKCCGSGPRDIYYAKYYGKGGGRNGQLGKKIKISLGKKNEIRERKEKENYIKKLNLKRGGGK